LKIDFSTGLMLTWLTDYNYTTLDTASMKQILRKNEGRIQFLVSTLVNVSYRLGEVINPTLSVGMGLSTEQRFQLLVGGGFSLSKFPRLVVTGGIAFGPVKRLQRPYIENGIYDIQTEAPTEQKFSYNVFAGITYNLTKVKTANAEETNY
jgi:opacity protein-like surface antigen